MFLDLWAVGGDQVGKNRHEVYKEVTGTTLVDELGKVFDLLQYKDHLPHSAWRKLD